MWKGCFPSVDIRCWYVPCYDSWSSERKKRERKEQVQDTTPWRTVLQWPLLAASRVRIEGRWRWRVLWLHIHFLLLPGDSSLSVKLLGSEYFLVMILTNPAACVSSYTQAQNLHLLPWNTHFHLIHQDFYCFYSHIQFLGWKLFFLLLYRIATK